MMRIIAGRLRGRKLDVPQGRATRPITDRAKETLFNILGSRFGVPGALPEFAVLDLFAGAGSLGLEALSRGAGSCLFVERDRRAVRALRDNVNHLRLGHAARISAENGWTMRIPPAPDAGYGLVFVDPPYRHALDPVPLLDLLERIAPQVLPEGVIVFRHEHTTRLPLERLRLLTCVDERELGTMRLWFFSPTVAAQSPSSQPPPGPDAVTGGPSGGAKSEDAERP